MHANAQNRKGRLSQNRGGGLSRKNERAYDTSHHHALGPSRRRCRISCVEPNGWGQQQSSHVHIHVQMARIYALMLRRPMAATALGRYCPATATTSICPWALCAGQTECPADYAPPAHAPSRPGPPPAGCLLVQKPSSYKQTRPTVRKHKHKKYSRAPSHVASRSWIYAL